MSSSGVPRIHPVGTQVVMRVPVAGRDRLYPAGAVAVAVHAPADATHAYRVRFPDGFETTLHPRELAGRKLTERPDLPAGGTQDEDSLFDRVIYRCVVGSRAYGLEEEGSDTDRRGIYLDDLIARKRAGPEQSAIEDADLALHEQEFARLRAELEAARDASPLPTRPAGRAALNDLLARLRLGSATR